MMRRDAEAKVILAERLRRTSVFSCAQRIHGICNSSDQERSLTVDVGSGKQSPWRWVKADELFIKASWRAIAECQNGWEALLDEFDLFRRHGSLRALRGNGNRCMFRKYRVPRANVASV